MEYRDPAINLEVDDQSLPLRETVFLTLRKAAAAKALADGAEIVWHEPEGVQPTTTFVIW